MRIEQGVERGCKTCDKRRWISRDHRRTGGAKRGKSPIAAERGAGAVGGHNSEMINVAREQTTDVGTDVQVGVPSVTLYRSRGPIASCWAILERDIRDKSMRID